NKRRVEVSGIFLIDKGIIEYGGKNYGVRDTRIVLKNSNVNIDGVVSLEKLFVAGISGTFDSKVGMGDLEITLDQISFETGKSRVTLDRTATKPVINYHIRPEGDILDAGGSSWNLDSLQLTLGSFSGPFSTKDLAITLPPTPLTISPGISTRIAGSLSFAAKKFDIHCDILKYQKADLVLEEAGLPISIQFDKELTITTEKQSRWRVNNVLTTLYPSKFRYGNDTLSMVNGRISYGDLFDSQISGHFNNLSKKGTFILGDLHIKKKNISELFGASTDIPVEVSLINDRLVITVPELALSISTAENKGWSATFHDLAAVHQRVRMWKEYLPDSGRLVISSKDGGQPYSVSADIPYQYHFLVKNNTPVTDLHISGEITGDGIHATVNEALQVQLNDHLAVTSKGVDFNLLEIISFLKDRSSTPTGNQEKNKSIKYTVDVEDSSLFLKPGSEILADRLHIDNMGGKTILRLEYGSGYINVDLKGNTFTIEGENLDHTFMSALAEDAQFENGKMSLAGRGNLDKFSILFKIEDTTLKKLKTLQNILAFANTIPALITFSLPVFDTRGLPVSSAVFGMVVEEGVATVESFDMKSSELNMSGNGIIDFPGKRIDMELNLITQARRNIKKIPLVGYILAGDDKRASVTLHISGNLHDPEVENSMLQQAVTLPFVVLLRTLALPAHLAGFMSDSGNGRKNKENDSESGEINELESGGDK
ncbi:MAG: AsmA-like C-terminal domain-containing protein, partial [Deltaproteobacteria bacterium]|nr:AsmA-like C-terminal domain-containing protein [Deltaproteobacteria bacterium]